MQKKPSASFLKPIVRLFNMFHMTIFIVFIIACLAAAVLFLTNMLNDASVGDDYTPTSGPGTIDQVTLDRINALHTSSDALPAPITYPTRSNPFTE